MHWYPLKGDGHTLWGRPFFEDPELNAALSSQRDVLWCTDHGDRLLAFPYDRGREFPLTQLFCFACIRCVEGRTCVVYRVDSEGRPVA